MPKKLKLTQPMGAPAVSGQTSLTAMFVYMYSSANSGHYANLVRT